MTRTKILFDNEHKVQSITIDGRDINEYIGRPIVLNLYNNDQEIAKAMTDTRAIIEDFTTAMDIAFSEHPDARELKEYYEKTLNVVGIFLLRLGDFSGAETIYQLMLKALGRFDGYTSVPLHKGMTFHNIAISQFMQQNFDQAIPNSLRATQEDVREGTPTGQSFSRRILEEQYTQPILDNMRNATDQIFQQMSGRQLGTLAVDFLQELEPAPRLFLLQIWKSLEINRPRDNLYSQSRAFDNAKNLALIAETFLRRTCEVSRVSTIRTAYLATMRPRLKDILGLLFGDARTPWFADVDNNWGQYANFDNTNVPADVDRKITSLLTTTLCASHDELIRGVLLLGLVRNFTAHEFEPASSLADANHDAVMAWMLATVLALLDESRNMHVL